MPEFFVKTWQTALEVKSFRVKSIVSGTLLILCALVAPLLFQFVQQREGYIFHDYLLSRLPAFDLSYWIFILLYILIFSAVVSLLSRPHQFLVALQAYIILTIFRFITILLVPLNPPLRIIELNDPLVQYLFYHEPITKDLFFSGHASLLLLLAFSVPSARLRYALFTGTLLVASMLLFQHAHYTVDILAAPIFSWLAYTMAKKLP